jgi:hypothetical protein
MPPTPFDLARRADEVVAHLRQFEVWAPSMTGAVVDRQSEEIEDLNPVPGDPASYHIFTVRRGNRITARLLLDPRDAKVMEVRGVNQAAAELTRFVDPVAAIQRHFLPLPVPVMPVGPWRMVWTYSAESTSRFRPFWKVTINHQTLFVRVDGSIFTTLTQAV